jgi:hypothetical protein
MSIAPIQLKALLLTKDTNGDGGSLCWFLHGLILGFAGKRQMSGYDDANQWGYQCQKRALTTVGRPARAERGSLESPAC